MLERGTRRVSLEPECRGLASVCLVRRDVRWGGVVESVVCEDEDLEQYSLPDWEPMQFN